jgi:predicted neuraminidase
MGRNGTLLCTFSHTREDGGTQIAVTSSEDAGTTWSAAEIVATPPERGYLADSTLLVTSSGIHVYWTQVLEPYVHSRFMVSARKDGSPEWSAPSDLNIPRRYISGKVQPPIWLDGKTAVMGFSYDVLAETGKPASEERRMYCRAGILRSVDEGATWSILNDSVDVPPHNADEPAIVLQGADRLLMILRTYDTHPWETQSSDAGAHWSKPVRSVHAAYNSPTAICRLKDGRLVRVWDNSSENRFPLVVSCSDNNGASWSAPRTLADQQRDPDGSVNLDQASYPSVMQVPNGEVVVVWQERLKAQATIRGARFDVNWLEKKD